LRKEEIKDEVGFYILDGEPAKPLAFIPFPKYKPIKDNTPIDESKALMNLLNALRCVKTGGKIAVHINDLGHDFAKKLIEQNGRYL
jgi:hypothetical protein